MAVQCTGHSRRGRDWAAAAVRPILPARRDRAARHVRRSGAWGHVGDMVAPTQAVVSSSHRIAHHVQVVAVAVTGKGGGWSLEVEALRENRGAEADAVHHPVHGLQGLAFPPEASWSAPKRTLFEHELAARIDGPVVAFPGPA